MELPQHRPIGYSWLAARFAIVTMPYWRESRALMKGAQRVIDKDGRLIESIPASRAPGDDVFDQLEFALKREGLHLELLRKLMPLLQRDELTAYARSRPTGRYARVVWWLYEHFTGSKLPLPDLTMGGYVDLLDEETYVVGSRHKVKRQRINVNLLGTVDFSPIVRKAGLGQWSEELLKARCETIADAYHPKIFQRAVRYLYAKESKSSHEIERETPHHRRAETFIGLLEQAWHRSFLEKKALVELQQAIVDPRYANDGWRSKNREQVYVGETLGPGHERIHFVAPCPEDLDELMESFLLMARRMTARRVKTSSGTWQVERSVVPTLVAAAVVSFVFNFLHPFSDGNGRIHRFLLHHVLAQNGFGPEGIILPVSAVILNRPLEYDQALESFSKPLMELVQYTMDDRLRMTVNNDTCDFYRYIDCTELTRITIDLIRETIETQLPTELNFLTAHDQIRAGIRHVVELPDRHIDLFISLVSQNGGTLSKKKRQLPEFSTLTDDEIAVMEKTVADCLID